MFIPLFYRRFCLHAVLVAVLAALFPSSAFAGGDGPPEVFARREFAVEFPINKWSVEPSFSLNARVLGALCAMLDSVAADDNLCLDEVAFFGAASPDGGNRINNPLAAKRVGAIRAWVAERYELPDSIVRSERSTVPWGTFRAMLRDSGREWAPRVLDVIDVGDDTSAADVDRRLRMLRRMNGGSVWSELARDFFPRLRMATVAMVTVRHIQPSPPPPPEPAPLPEPEPAPVADVAVQEEPAKPVEEPESDSTPVCDRFWALRTNVAAWAMFQANISGEWQFACRWSASASVYYSAWNYCTSTRKFRTFVFRPEVRYWFRDGGRGLFVDAHLGMVSFNFALDRSMWRYQDRGGKHPSLGGGVGVGFRLPLSRDGRWRAEAQVGVGVYSLDYDRFHNEPNGQWHDSERRTYFGLDNAAVSVVFVFDAKGGAR